MLIEQKTGNLVSFPTGKKVDWLPLEWYETDKRILHRNTTTGTEIVLKFLKQNQHLTQGDIIYEDGEVIIAVDILPCEAIVIKPASTFEIAAVCYEIGNKHLPLFYEKDELMTAYEMPLFNLLISLGYAVSKEVRKLVMPLKTSVAFHAHLGSESLFSAITNISTSAE